MCACVCRLACSCFQLWVSKPFYPAFTRNQLGLLLVSSTANIAANELLVRPLCAAWFSAGLPAISCGADVMGLGVSVSCTCCLQPQPMCWVPGWIERVFMA